MTTASNLEHQLDWLYRERADAVARGWIYTIEAFDRDIAETKMRLAAIAKYRGALNHGIPTDPGQPKPSDKAGQLSKRWFDLVSKIETQ